MGRIITRQPIEKIHFHPTKKGGVIPRPAFCKAMPITNYLDLANIPDAPDIWDGYGLAQSLGSVQLANLIQMLMNNSIGDCPVAAYFHMKEMICAMAGKPVVFQDSDALTMYQQATAATLPPGYDPNEAQDGVNPTDTGLVLVDFLNWLMNQGLILAHAEVNFHNAALEAKCRNLFNGLFTAYNLPAAVFNMGTTWTVPGAFSTVLGDLTAGSAGGHCVPEGYGVNADASKKVTTWQEIIEVKPDFKAAYQTESHIIVFPESAAALDAATKGTFGLQDLISDTNMVARAA